MHAWNDVRIIYILHLCICFSIYLFSKFSWNDFPRQYFHVAPSTFLINWLVLSEPACYVYKAINWLCQICVSVLDIITIISRALFNYFFKIKIALATRATSTSLSSQAAVGHCHRQQQSDNIVVMAGTSTEWRPSLGQCDGARDRDHQLDSSWRGQALCREEPLIPADNVR